MNKYDDTDYQIEREESIEYKKGNDTNVGSIEEAIKILKNTIKCNEKQFEELGTHILLQEDDEEAIKIILGNLDALCDMQKMADIELKNARKINEEHQKINGELREKVKDLDTKNDELLKDLYSANCIIADLTDSISKQNIKDKIEELRNDIKNDNCRYPSILEHKIDVLKELLEDK